MKQFNFLSFLFIFTFLFLNAENNYAQQVARNYVVMELGTGTWCVNCPAAARGADDMVNNGHSVAVIENHNGDSYAYTASNARNNYYGITGYPTAFFDGKYPVVGGSYAGNMYSSYLAKYNTAIAVMSDFSLDVTYTHTGDDYDVTIDIEEPGDYAGTNLVVHLVLTESHIAENWQGMTELDFVSRAMYPTHTGTAFTGGTESLNLSFTANAAWDLSNCELVAFIQDNSTKDILQSDKISLAGPTGVNNASVVGVENMPETCDYLISPILSVENLGSADITSLEIDYSINGGNTTGTYNWSGDPIALFDEASIVLEDISFAILNATNDIDFDITHVNGVADDDTSNNTLSASFNEALAAVDDYLRLYMITDNNGAECTWTIEDSTGTVVESGGPYGNNETVNVYPELLHDCYTFSIFDAGGDGGGSVILVDADNTALYYSSGNYGAGEIQEFVIPDVGQSVDDQAFASVVLFPNPTNATLNIENANGLSVAIMDVLGRELFMQKITTTKQQIDVENFAEGTYIVRLTDGVKVRTEKIIISR